MDDRHVTGRQAEQQARAYLEQQGLKLAASNWHCRAGELDLVMHDHSTLVFVEVRYRNSLRYGTAAETVNHRKQQKIIRAAQYYLQKNPSTKNCRFDIIAVSPGCSGNRVEWIRNAFTL